ncbi:MAG: polysaccharide (de)acetylase [Weeksellaceae bacterium]|nr:polysaccharide (de)acetylase [Weeksellaceae bacterium]
MELLLDVLSSFKDKNDNHPKFTLFLNPANPDFEKIKESDFAAYYFEPFTKTLKKYDNTDKIIDLYNEGIKEDLISIQFHGREHLQFNRWLKDLRVGNKDLINGFEARFWGFSKSYAPLLDKNYRAAFDVDDSEDLKSQKEAIISGVELIRNIFDIVPTVFVAPDGPYNLSLNKTLHEAGIKYIGLAKIHREPLGNSKYATKYFWLGKNLKKDGLTIITRNSIFEPNKSENPDWVLSCMKEIESAFRWKKPAIISTHRVNYIGTHSSANRDSGLKQLSQLLKEITKRWPDVEFMTSAELGELISKRGK